MSSLDEIYLVENHLVDSGSSISSPLESLTEIDYGTQRLLCSLFHCRTCRPSAVDRIYNPTIGLLSETPCCLHFAIKQNWPQQLPLTLISIVVGFLLENVEESFLTSTLDPSFGVCQSKIIKSEGTYEMFLDLHNNSRYEKLKSVFSLLNGSEDHMKKFKSVIFPPKNIVDTERNETKCHKDSLSHSNSPLPTDLDHIVGQHQIRDLIIANTQHLLQRNQDVFLASCYPERDCVFPFLSLPSSFNVTSERMQYSQSQHSNKITFTSAMFLGKVKCNKLKNEFTLFDFTNSVDNGIYHNPDCKDRDKTKTAIPLRNIRRLRESGLVQFSKFLSHDDLLSVRLLLPHRTFKEFLTQDTFSKWNILKYLSLFNDNKSKISRQYQLEQKQRDQRVQENRYLGNALSEFTNFNTAAVRSNLLNSVNQTNACPSLPPRNFYSHAESENQQVEVFENLRPVWHIQMGTWVLHFDNERIKQSSVYNFKLVRVNDVEKKTILQFGPGERDGEFVMDFQYPLSPLVAFQICVGVINQTVCKP